MSIIPKSLEAQGNRSWRVTTQPVIEPITVEYLKLFARVDGDEEDELLASFIKTARTMMEQYLGRALIHQTITLNMDHWPGMIINLPRPPLISITSVNTLDEDDTATEYDSSYYYAITTSEPGQLVIRMGYTPPINSAREYGGYQVVYLAGYGSGTTSVPQPIRDGIAIWATDIYDNRKMSDEPPEYVKSIVQSYRIPPMVY